MIQKFILIAFLVLAVCAIQRREETHLETEEQHDLFGLFKPNNPKNRSEQEVCEHYGGKMCTVLKVGTKCCKDGLIFKNTHCGGVGCEHDTLSITDMAWDY